MAANNSCNLILNYCEELEKGIETFDIELINRKLDEFPKLILMESVYQKMIH
jgi:hypothetical protein